LEKKDAERVQPNSGPDGRFLVYGLRPGRYVITAMDYMRESRPLEIEIDVEREPAPLRIVLLPERQLLGRLTSSVGPVVGGTVRVYPTDVPADSIFAAHSDDAGVFTSTLPPAAEQLDLVVEPPGFALKIFHTRWESGRLVVPVRQDGGTLTVEGVPVAGAVLQHDGAALPLVFLRYWPETSTAGERTAMAMLEPGNYTVCTLDRANCASGFLPPFGTLTLQLRTKSAAR
jgi:hypothetical protein